MSELKKIFLDTSFFVRLFDPTDKHHQNAQTYFRRFRNEGAEMYLSTLAVTEYGIGGNIDFLPYNFLRLLPFNIDHARLASNMARASMDKKKKWIVKTGKRMSIPNDIKLIAQAETSGVDLFVGADENCQKVFSFLKEEGLASARYLDLGTPPNEFFNELFSDI